MIYCSNRANVVLASSGRGRQYKLPVPNGVTAPQIALASQPISTQDIDMVSKTVFLDVKVSRCTCRGGQIIFFYTS